MHVCTGFSTSSTSFASRKGWLYLEHNACCSQSAVELDWASRTFKTPFLRTTISPWWAPSVWIRLSRTFLPWNAPTASLAVCKMNSEASFKTECVFMSTFTCQFLNHLGVLFEGCICLCESVSAVWLHSVLEWVDIPSSGDLPDLGIEPQSPALSADSLLSEPPGKPFIRRRWY